MRRQAASVAPLLALTLALSAAPALGAEAPCDKAHKYECFGVESASASLSDTQAGAHPDVTIGFDLAKDPESKPSPAGLKQPYAATRDVRIELPPGLIGDPNVLGVSEQCTAADLFSFEEEGGGCPVGSQVGISKVSLEEGGFTEPIYMMGPPGGDVVARIGMIAAIFPLFIDFRVRSESDYGLTAEIVDASPERKLSRVVTTVWGVPADPVHERERCTPAEVGREECVFSPPRNPGGRPLPFMTNPTTCGVPLPVSISASSWAEPDRFSTKTASFPEISGCNSLPFGPGLEVEPTSHRAGSPTGANVTIKLPASAGVHVLEPSQMREVKIRFPQGLAVNTGASAGLGTCSPAEVAIGKNEAAHCPDAAKLAATEFNIPVLERNLKGAIYLREPEPGDPFRIWIVADDLGLHLKLPGELHIDKSTGQIESIVLDPRAETEGLLSTGGIPQAPVREARLNLKSGFRAPLLNPPSCGEYRTEYDIVPWSGTPIAPKQTEPFKIYEGCDTGSFSPKLTAGSTNTQAGAFSPFLFKINREDGEQNIEKLNVTLPRGVSASFAGIPRCEGAAAETGACPAGSRVGKVVAAVGAGHDPLWVPEEGKRPAAAYLGGPYKGAPLSIFAVVPKQAGPFDFGDEVVRSAIYVDPETAQATAKADSLPQVVPQVGVPLYYRTIFVELNRTGFTLNPTSCARKATEATLISPTGVVARPSSPFAAVNCAKLGFKPKLSLRLVGGVHRGAHPKLTAAIRPQSGDANIAGISVALPHSEFLDQGHIVTVCTRVQFAAHSCPGGSVYGHLRARTPIFDFPLEGPIYLRSSNHLLPDMVAELKGPASFPVEIDAVGRIDSVHGGIRTTFRTIPDAPVDEIVASFPGGKKGLLENSTNVCTGKHRATADFKAQNGRRKLLHPALKVSCSKRQRSAKKT
jgi:hypothetical protein